MNRPTAPAFALTGILIGAAVGALASVLVGCTPKAQPSATQPLPGDAPGAARTLADDDRDALRAAFKALPPPGFTPQPPAQLGQLRWSDLPAAVQGALLANDASVVSSTVTADSAAFRFLTTTGLRGTVSATRVQSPALAEVAVTIDSALPSDDREAAIVAGVHERLLALAGRRKLEDYAPR